MPPVSDTFAIDFETYYDKNVSITKQGSHHYVRHPDSDVYMVSVVNDEFQWVGHPEDFNWDLLRGKHLVAHNMSFDGTVLKFLQERGLVPNDVGSAGLHCTADMAAYFQMPRNLKGAAKEMLGDYEEMDKAMRTYAKGRYWRDMDDIHKKMMLDYALKDSQACWELWKRWGPKWPDAEQRVSRHTRKMMWDGVCVDTNLLAAYIYKMRRQNWEAQQNIPWADSAPILSRKEFDNACRQSNIAPPQSLAQDDPTAMAWMATYSPQFPWVDAVATWRRTNTFLTKLESIQNRVRDDGRMSVELKYFGAAATGRWSGAGGVNLQNLPRERVFDVDFRKLFIPAPGKKFVISDLAQIEPRCMAWLVRDKELLQMVRDGFPIYEAHARATMGWTGGKLKDEDPDRYRLAKARVLGLGYGAGAAKFQAIAKSMCGINLSLMEAKRSVWDFRDSSERVVKGWGVLEDRMRKTYGQAFHGGEENRYGVQIPSGRTINYYDIQNMGGLTATTTKGDPRRYHWYGGKLIENLVQGCARDVMRDCILDVEDAGHPIKFHVHDEVVCEVDQDVKPETIEALMSKTPDWMPGLPMGAEAFEAEHYTK